MDTISYLPDPADATLMINIITDHNRFTQEYVKNEALKQLAKYDSYDRSNDYAARMCLLDSVEESLKNIVEDRIPRSNPTFLQAWMLVIQVIQSDSVFRFESMKTKLIAIVPSKFAGQNIADMSMEVLKLCRALHSAGMFDHQLNSKILDNFRLAEGDDRYSLSLTQLQLNLDVALQEIRYETDRVQAHNKLIAKGLSFEHICQHAESRYRDAIENNRWPSQKNLRDSKAPPEKFSKAQVNALIQHFSGNKSNGQSTNRDKSKDICHLCKKTGHWAKDYPNAPGNTAANNNKNNTGDQNPGHRPTGGGRGRGNHAGRSQDVEAVVAEQIIEAVVVEDEVSPLATD